MAKLFDGRKFRELVLYLCDRSLDDPRFGATKLNKLLYFSDFEIFGITGRSITGATYRRLAHGPAPLEILDELRRMEGEGEIRRIEKRYFHLQQKRVEALRDPDMSDFNELEIEIIDSVLAELRQMNASEVSALSHLEVGWQVAGDREVIPYEAVFISDRRPTAAEIDGRGHPLGTGSN